MAKWGDVDFSALERLANAFQKAQDERLVERFIRDFLLEMAYRALRKIKKRTPVDTGELRRNWAVGHVQKRGDSYIVEVFNNTDYASFVEFGHRSGMNLTNWTEGRFMMTISMKDIERDLTKYLEKRQTEFMDNLMNGRPPKKGD